MEKFEEDADASIKEGARPVKWLHSLIIQIVKRGSKVAQVMLLEERGTILESEKLDVTDSVLVRWRNGNPSIDTGFWNQTVNIRLKLLYSDLW